MNFTTEGQNHDDPRDWLVGQTSPADVEADLAELGAPDLWLRQWRAMRDRMAPGDQLWEYLGAEYADPVVPAADEIAGFEQIPDTEAVDRLGLAESPVGMVDSRDGFAVVRGEEILDWIESPP
jgi:hypothetical protein